MAFLDNIGLEHLWAHIIAKLGYKVDKVDGKGLSTNDYTDEDKAKVANLDVDGITPIEKGGTNATDAATARANLEITPANIGALPISGGTLSGVLYVANNATNPKVAFIPTALGKETGAISYNTPTDSARNRLHITEYSRSSEDFSRLSTYEAYYLPYAQEDLTANAWYPILTGKNAVTVEQGGTGAKNAADARTNLEITPENIGALSASGGSLNGTLHINGGPLYIKSMSSDNEGGEIWLKAPSGNSAVNHLVIDNLGGNLRVFGAPSDDGTTVTGVGTPLVINTYAKTISGGYTFNGNAATATTLSATLSIDKGGTGATTKADARTNIGIMSGTTLPETGEVGDIFILYTESE